MPRKVLPKARTNFHVHLIDAATWNRTHASSVAPDWATVARASKSYLIPALRGLRRSSPENARSCRRPGQWRRQTRCRRRHRGDEMPVAGPDTRYCRDQSSGWSSKFGFHLEASNFFLSEFLPMLVVLWLEEKCLDWDVLGSIPVTSKLFSEEPAKLNC